MTQLRATTLTSQDIAALPSAALRSMEAVTNQTLWTDGTSLTGVLRIEAGHRLGAHTHRRHHHHYWLIAGEADVLDHRLGPGSYVHIPAGLEHDIDASETDGCTVYYAYWLPGQDDDVVTTGV